jgi:hypothetical protein
LRPEQLGRPEQTPDYIGMDGNHILLLGKSHSELKCFARLPESCLAVTGMTVEGGRVPVYPTVHGKDEIYGDVRNV